MTGGRRLAVQISSAFFQVVQDGGGGGGGGGRGKGKGRGRAAASFQEPAAVADTRVHGGAVGTGMGGGEEHSRLHTTTLSPLPTNISLTLTPSPSSPRLVTAGHPAAAAIVTLVVSPSPPSVPATHTYTTTAVGPRILPGVRVRPAWVQVLRFLLRWIMGCFPFVLVAIELLLGGVGPR